MKIIVAGIGGLTVALLLHKAGAKVKVFESATTIRLPGVGINLLPHSVAVPEKLDPVPKVHHIAVFVKALLYYNKSGQKFWEQARGIYAGYKMPRGGLS